MLRYGIWGLLGWLACCTGAWGADSPLSFFTPQVDVIIRLHEPDQTIDQLAELVDQVQPGVGDVVRGQSAALGQMISNPTLTGVDQSRDWYAGVYANAEGDPQVIFAIPAVNADDFVSALPEGIASVIKGNWVLYTEADAVLLPTDDQTAEKLVSGEVLEHLQKGNFSVFVNALHLVEVYADQLELAEDRMLEQLNNLRFQPNNAGVNLEAAMEMYGTMAEMAFQGLRDAQSFCLTVTADSKGIALDDIIVFKEGSDAAKLFESCPPKALPLLNKLPSGAVAYFGYSGMIHQLTKWGTEFSLGMFTKDDQKESIKNLMQRLGEIKMDSIVGSVQLEESPNGLLQISAIGEAEPIEAFKQYSRDSIDLLAKMDVPGFKQTATLKADAETFGDLKGDVITVTQEFEPENDPLGIQTKMRDILIGPEGQTSRMVYLKDKYCQTTGGGMEIMSDLLASLESSKNNNVEKFRSDLFPEINMIVLVDVPAIVSIALKEVSKLEDIPLPINEQMIDNLNLRRSYIGFAGATSGGSVKQQVRIPIDQIQGFAKLGILFASLQQQQRF